MNGPPIPIRPGDWAALLAALTLNSSGHLVHSATGQRYYLAAVDDGAGGIAWLVSTTAPSSGVVECSMTSTTFAVLKNGTTNSNGTVSSGGLAYKIALYWDGASVTCKAI